MHKIVGNDFELRSNLLAVESQGMANISLTRHQGEIMTALTRVGWVEPEKPNKSCVLIYVGFRSSTQPT